MFNKYGPIVDSDLKNPPYPPGYYFIEFEDAQDAEDAIYGRDEYNFDGHCLRVEQVHSSTLDELLSRYGHEGSLEDYEHDNGWSPYRTFTVHTKGFCIKYTKKNLDDNEEDCSEDENDSTIDDLDPILPMCLNINGRIDHTQNFDVVTREDSMLVDSLEEDKLQGTVDFG